MNESILAMLGIISFIVLVFVYLTIQMNSDKKPKNTKND